MTTIEVVVGAQFGSEAKGHVVQRLTERVHQGGGIPQVIRVAGPNAGHTGYDAAGRKWALRQIPVAAVTNGEVQLGIAAGSEIDLPVLLDEFDSLTEAGLMIGKRLWISEEATLISDWHKAVEGGLIDRIGSTGKGIGAARMDRLGREPGMRVLDSPGVMAQFHARNIAINGPQFDPLAAGRHTIIEGTQGYGLGLRAGYYPQCTSSDCRAIDFLAMAGVNPWSVADHRPNDIKVYAVARIYPIRVAGNSGPLKNETTWKDLGLPEEKTTVTNKVRRVGMPDWDLVRDAVRANGGAPTVRVALTMVDQLFPGTKDIQLKDYANVDRVMDVIKDIESDIGASIELVTTGPNTASWL